MTGFLKTTIIGGILFLVPFAVLAVVLGKVFPIAQKLVAPLADFIPFDSIIGLNVPIALTSALILLLCFGVGLLAKTRIAKYLVNRLENSVMRKIPGYELLQSISADVAGVGGKDGHRVVLVRFDDAWQFGLKIDEISGGKLVAVFIPDSPTPQTGAMMMVEADRVRPTNIPIASLFACLTHRGNGLRKLLSA
ncbi:MAG: DUF502 domain-containing protein [Pseudomonadota bacterium]